MSQQLIFDNNVAACLQAIIAEQKPGRTFVIADENTARYTPLTDAETIVMPAGDVAKNLDTAVFVWQTLSDRAATRHDLVVNFGGGVVTDLGGFCAATYKRGMPFVNVPTTLLGAVDAAVGGKTGINFGGFKNQVGAFAPAMAVIISTRYFATLPPSELLSGYAEMVKHGLLTGMSEFAELLRFDILNKAAGPEMLDLLARSVQVKQRIVEADPTEKGLRKALNLGHTVGHALEELALRANRPVPHGYAVAWGLVAAVALSHIRQGLDTKTVHALADFVSANYPAPAITCDDYDEILALMANDKKNTRPGQITFTLLSAPGQPVINATATPAEITAALDLMRDLLHI